MELKLSIALVCSKSKNVLVYVFSARFSGGVRECVGDTLLANHLQIVLVFNHLKAL